MAVPKQVSKKLQQNWGEAGGLMTEWLEELEETSRGTRAALDGMEAQLTALREEMRLGFARIDVRFAEMDARIEAVEKRMAQQLTRVLMWAITVGLASLGLVMGYMTWLVRGFR